MPRPCDGNEGCVPSASSRPTVPEDTSTGERLHAWCYRATTWALALLLAVVVLDGLSVVDAFGPDKSTGTAVADGYRLSVTAATVTRPALATPFEISVRREGGFDAPVEVAIETDYLSLFDYQRMYPEPSGERTAGDFTVMEFDPPDGDELVITFDWRLEPAVQTGRDVTVAVVEGGRHVVEVTRHLRVWP
jgi:hypothetical protein